MKPERALIATTMNDPVILATDGACVAWDIGENGDNAADLGMVMNKAKDLPTPGLYLWEGKMEQKYYGIGEHCEVGYTGTIRPVKPDEMAELFAMKPPPDPRDGDDRDQPIVWNGMTVGP